MAPTFAVYVKFLACMITQPTVCHDQQMQFVSDRDLTLQQCMHNAMPELAKWAEQHPKFRIVRFSCVTKPEIDA